MATTYHADLQKLYVAYFNRPADFAGLAYWEGVVEAANGNTAGVSAAFAASKEYKDEYGSLTNAQIITKIYANLFNKTPDALGKAYWVDKLDTKVFTIDQIVAEVAGGAQGSDKIAFGNKVLAADAFTTALDTKAEQDSYSGAAANAAAKAFIAGITTDASLAAAITPAALAESVATVVKAGTPFTLENGLADLYGSHDAVTTFLAGLDLDNDADTDTEEGDVGQAVIDADAAVAVQVGGGYTGSDAVKAAVLADTQKALDTTLATQQKAVTAAIKDAAAVKGLSAAVDTAAAADTSEVAAGKALTAADAVQAAAAASYNTLHSAAAEQLTIDASGTVTDSAGTPKDLIVLKSGKLVLATGVTETTNPGITSVLNAIKADLAAAAAHDASVAAAAQAHLDVNILDSAGSAEDAKLADVGAAFNLSLSKPVDADHPTAVEIQTQITGLTAAVNSAAAADKPAAQAALDAFNAKVLAFTTGNVDPLAKAISDAQADVKTTTDKITDLDKAVADLGVANANAATLAHLHDVIDAATAAFEDNGFLAPVTLTSGFAGATAGSDIFLVDTDNVASTISNFGLSGDDVLYVGKGYTLNSGALTAGNDSVLEVFLIQKGANVEVTIETKAFGSHSADPEIKITLTGVTVDQLEFSNGIITHV